MVKYILVKNEADYARAAILFKEYAKWLNIDLCFQNFDTELEQLATIYSPKVGGIILAVSENTCVGCIALRKLEHDTAELKRMYVVEESRKDGVGQALLMKALALAGSLKYKKIRLDTLSNMIPAIRLYERNGFYEIPAYYHNPETNAVYFEKVL